MSRVATKLKEPLTRVDAAITAGFFLVGLATRIPFRSGYLFAWDSAGFALALERFSLAEHQPHPPGYIIYVGLGRLLNFFVHDANTALVAISVLGSAASVAGAFLLGRAIFERRTGIAAGALMLFSPLNWFYGEIAYAYVVGLALSTLATWFLYEWIFERRYPIATAITLGLAAGIRTDIFLFLVVFFLIGSFRVNRRTAMLSWAALAVSLLAWLIPLIYVTGGMSTYLEIITAQSDVVVVQLSPISGGLTKLIENATSIASALILLLGSAIFVLAYSAWRAIFRGWLREDNRILFLLLLTVPPLVFFLFFIIDVPGYPLVFSVPIILVAARSFVLVSTAIPGKRVKAPGKSSQIPVGNLILVLIIMIISITNASLFLAPEETLSWVPSTGGKELGRLFAFNGSYSVIAAEDKKIANLTYKAHEFETGKTVVMAYNLGEWRRLGYYLPEYTVITHGPPDDPTFFTMIGHVWTKQRGTLQISMPAATEQLLLMNPVASEAPQKARRLNAELTPAYVFALPAETEVDFEGYSILRQNSSP